MAMFHLALLCTFLAYASAQECCSMGDRQELLNTWQTLWGAENTDRRVLITQEIFKRVFTKAPEAKDLLTRVNANDITSAEFRAHCVRVANGLDTIINMAFNSDSLEEQLQHLGDQHAKYDGMKADYFRLFRESLSEVLPQVIPCFNKDVWNRCLTVMHDRIGQSLSA